MSQHSGYQSLNWGDIQNTFNTADAGLPRGGDNGLQNRDHAKVYVAWSKHAHYNTRNTGWNDPLSQLLDNAFRSQDWWYFPTKGECDFVREKPAFLELNYSGFNVLTMFAQEIIFVRIDRLP